MRTAFPDFPFALEDIIAEGDRVVMRGIMSGTITGPFMEMPPTNAQATWIGTHTYRPSNEKIVEHWGNIDMTGTMKQLGHIPS